MASIITPLYYSQNSVQPFDNDLTGDISAADTNNYISQLYAKQVLYKFYASTIFKEITNTSYEGEFKKGGASIIIRQAPDVVSAAYTKGMTLIYTSPAKVSLEMIIDQAFYQGIAIDDIDKLQKDIDLMAMYVESARKSMQVEIDTNVLAYMADNGIAANLGATAGAVSSSINMGTDSLTLYVGIDSTNALDKIVEIGQVLGEQNLGDEERFVVIPEWYATRLKKSDLKAADMTGDTTSPIRTGLIGAINNTKVYVSNNLDKGTTNTSAYAVIGGTKMATAFAMQIEKTESLRVEGSFGDKWRSLYVYGRKAVRPEGLTTLWCMPS